MLCWTPSITPSRSASQPPGTQANSSAFLTLGQISPQPGRVAGEPPVEIGLHDLAHLSVGGGDAAGLLAVRQSHAEWAARLASSRRSSKAASRSERASDGNRCGVVRLVIPDVRAVAVAAAALVVDAFEAVELAVGRAETGGA